MLSWDTWWLWTAAALIFAILEVLAPGYILLGFAIGAAITGGVLLIGGPLAAFIAGSLPSLLVAFAVMSLLAWIILRRVFSLKSGNVKTFDHDINDR